MKIRIIAVLLTLFSSFSYVSFVDNNPISKEVCAVGGTQCIRRVASCSFLDPSFAPGLHVNLSEAISNITLHPPLTLFNVGRSLDLTYIADSEFSNYCLPRNTISSFIPHVLPPGTEGTELKQNDLRAYIGNEGYRVTVRGCLEGDVPSSGRVLPMYGISASGCCSFGEIFVYPENIEGEPGQIGSVRLDHPKDAQQYGMCCPVGSTKVEGDICYNDALQVTGEPSPNLAVPLSGLGGYIAPGENDGGSQLVCPSSSDCVLTSNTSGGVCNYTIDGQTCIYDPAKLQTDSNLQCQSCFRAGEAVGIVTRDGDPNNGKLALCRTGGALEYVDAVNNSETDTLACLRSEGGYSGTNFQQCKSCRESGGTWSGLGCIDSTPTGIVTWLIRIAYGVMGGVALIQFIIAGIYYQTGQEDKVREARKNLIATITGLAVLTFSILILRIIGINVLDILPIGSV